MKKKIKNTSNYWCSYEGDLSIYYFIRWKGTVSNQVISSSFEKFVSQYVALTNKYQILLPVYPAKYDNIDALTINRLLTTYNKTYANTDRKWDALSALYIYMQSGLLYPSLLFIEKDSKVEREVVVNVEKEVLLTLEKFDNYFSIRGMPLRIVFDTNAINEVFLYISLDVDLFFLMLDNKKTKKDKYPFEIDNSELAYLNTPRLNSFIRDLRVLCFEFGANNFEMENLWDNDSNNPEYFSEDGVLFKAEVIYYEDIYDLLPEEHKIKEFEQIQLDLDATNYNEYAKNKKR